MCDDWNIPVLEILYLRHLFIVDTSEPNKPSRSCVLRFFAGTQLISSPATETSPLIELPWLELQLDGSAESCVSLMENLSCIICMSQVDRYMVFGGFTDVQIHLIPFISRHYESNRSICGLIIDTRDQKILPQVFHAD